MKHINIPIFVPHEGCPHDCSFCNQKRITGITRRESENEIKNRIENIINSVKDERYIEIAFFGGSFTGIEEARQKKLLSIAAEYLEKGKINGIRLSTRPDYISAHILNYLEDYGVSDIELGVQSMDDEVLLANNRGHDAHCVAEASTLIKSYGAFRLGLQQMPGLYMSNPEKDIISAKKIAELKPDNTRIYPTIILENTRLYDLYIHNEYEPYSLEKAVFVSGEIYKICMQSGINVIRIGLQSTDIVNEKKVYGPYHSSFGELVLSRVLRDEIEVEVEKNRRNFTVFAPRNMISKVTGNKKSNILYFKEKYAIKMKVCEDNKLCNFFVTFD